MRRHRRRPAAAEARQQLAAWLAAAADGGELRRVERMEEARRTPTAMVRRRRPHIVRCAGCRPRGGAFLPGLRGIAPALLGPANSVTMSKTNTAHKRLGLEIPIARFEH